MKHKTITINELLKGNKRACLSANRVFFRCELCPQFEKCESRVLNPLLSEKINKLKQMKADFKKLKKDIKEFERGFENNARTTINKSNQ